MTSGKGIGVTPERVKQLVTEAVKAESQYAVSKKTGLALSVIQAILKGDREPSTGTLQKLSQFFNVPVHELRGENAIWEEIHSKLPEVYKELLLKAASALSDKELGAGYYECFRLLLSISDPDCLRKCQCDIESRM